MGAYFVRAGRRVTFVDADPEHVDAVRNRGLSIEGPIDAFTVRAEIHTPDTLRGRWETVLLCVKAHHTEVAAWQLLPFLGGEATVVSVQNGLNEEVLAAVVGAEPVVGAFVNFGADVLGPGRIHFGGRGAVVVGEVDGRDTARVRALHELLRVFEPDAIATGNVLGYLWGKLAYGGMLFATALTNDSIADALARPEARPVFVGIAQEAVSVALAEGIQPEGFNGFDPEAFRPGVAQEDIDASIVEMVRFNRLSAKTHSGIWRDLAVRKRPTEVDAQMGAVVRHAERSGVEVPLTRATIAMIHDVENGRLALAGENLEALAVRAAGSPAAAVMD